MWHFDEDIVDENQDRRIKRKNINHQESIRVLAPASARTARARRKTITIRSTRKTKKTIQTTIRRRTRNQAEEEEQQQQQQSNHFYCCHHQEAEGSRTKRNKRQGSGGCAFGGRPRPPQSPFSASRSTFAQQLHCNDNENRKRRKNTENQATTLRIKENARYAWKLQKTGEF